MLAEGLQQETLALHVLLPRSAACVRRSVRLGHGRRHHAVGARRTFTLPSVTGRATVTVGTDSQARSRIDSERSPDVVRLTFPSQQRLSAGRHSRLNASR